MNLTIYKELWAGAYRYRFWSFEWQKYVFVSEAEAEMLHTLGKAQIVSLC